MALVGIVGWRGMVGSVLMERMQAENDFALFEPLFFSTSNAGGAAPAQARNEKTLVDANDLKALARCDIVVTAQGGDDTTRGACSCGVHTHEACVRMGAPEDGHGQHVR